MDKSEYKLRAEEIKDLISRGEYAQAAEIADTIDWRRVKSVMMLCTISDLYKINRRYEDARDMLLLAYERRPGGRTICYSLCELSIKMEEYVQAIEYYKEFVQVAPKDPGRYILQYKLYEAQDVSLEERIAVLEELKKRDYREKWAYELAYLYHRVGLAARCVEECDELILWFGEGKYVIKAMELKMLHQPLTPEQQEKYDHRNDGIGRKDSSKRKPSFRKSKERPAPNPRIADKVRKDVHVTDSIDLPDLPEPMARTHASEPEAESQPKTRIRSTSDISTTISGASLSDALKAGVAVASGAVAPESASDDSQMTGKMKIEEILANWEATQRENAKILEKSQEEAEKEKALREKKKEEEEEVLGATKPILSDDIRKLMEQLENGEEPEITDEDAEDFVDDEEDEATESPEDSSKEASDTDEEDPEENPDEEPEEPEANSDEK